jgi:hypothetical protein
MERASKISHHEIIATASVQALIEQCEIPRPPESRDLEQLLQHRIEPSATKLRHVIAIDGGYTEVSVRQEFPSSTITFFTFGPLLFSLQDLRDLNFQPFIAPEDLARLKRIQRFSLALPTKNMSLRGLSLTDSVRQTLQEFVEHKTNDADEPLAEALRWLVFARWENPPGTWNLPSCPNAGCNAVDVSVSDDDSFRSVCPACDRPIYLIDVFRLHERIDEEQGASGIISYVMTALEQVVFVYVVKALLALSPRVLGECLMIKDGPLAFFGTTAPLSRRMQELVVYLVQRQQSGGSGFNFVGLEKSGAFVEHAAQIERMMGSDTILPLSTEYIYRYIVPGQGDNSRPYAWNTYWGGKLIFKAGDASTYVATVPLASVTGSPTLGDYAGLDEVLSVLGELRCSMYDNALIPVALANKLVSLSDFPSSRILERFAKTSLP